MSWVVLLCGVPRCLGAGCVSGVSVAGCGGVRGVCSVCLRGRAELLCDEYYDTSSPTVQTGQHLLLVLALATIKTRETIHTARARPPERITISRGFLQIAHEASHTSLHSPLVGEEGQSSSFFWSASLGALTHDAVVSPHRPTTIRSSQHLARTLSCAAGVATHTYTIVPISCVPLQCQLDRAMLLRAHLIASDTPLHAS